MKLYKIFLLALIFLTACSPQATPTASPPDVSETDSATEQNSSRDPSTAWLWKEIRDERFGFGLAVPCWWEVTDMPADGIIASMTVRNYDEAFFTKYSDKGSWIGGNPPQGVISMDITAVTGIDPTLSLEEAYLTSVDSSTYTVTSSQEKDINGRIYTVIALKNQKNQSEPTSIVYIKGLAPDTILIFSTTPNEAMFSNDAQAIFSSFSSVPDEEIVIPQLLPSNALINVACPL